MQHIACSMFQAGALMLLGKRPFGQGKEEGLVWHPSRLVQLRQFRRRPLNDLQEPASP